MISEGIKCDPVTCPDPGSVRNSKRFPTSSIRNINKYNYAFQYHCVEGYWFTAWYSYTEVKCNETGQWDPNPMHLMCSRVDCGDPGLVERSVRIGESFLFEDEVEYACLKGFEISKNNYSQITTCHYSGTWIPHPSTIRCHATVCNPLPDIHDGSFTRVKREPEVYFSGDHATLTCDVGYTIDAFHASIRFTCQPNGDWKPDVVGRTTVHCEPIHCPAPPDIIQGGLVLTGHKDVYKKGDEAYYVCPRGKWKPPHGRVNYVNITCTVEQRGSERSLASYTILWKPLSYSIRCVDVVCVFPGKG
ncbi:beta-2-glycoprotein 1-like [Ciona intestinalis]